MSILVICPTRGRPDKARETHETFQATKVDPETQILFVVDADDPELGAYEATGIPLTINAGETGTGMAAPVNVVAANAAGLYVVLGFVGDDHRFRTEAWDHDILTTLIEKPGFAYGNDGIRSDIPTQVFISAAIVRALGWFCLPGAHHLYLDNTWAYLGKMTDSLTYLPKVLIEHMHPFFGKGEMDEHYARVNAQTVYQHDAKVFEEWLDNQADKDVELVRQAIR